MSAVPLWVNFIPWGLVQTVVAGAIATYVLTPIYDHLHIQATSKVRTDMQAAIQNSLQFAVAKAHGSPENIMQDNDLWNDVINVAKDYLNENADGIMRKLGVDPNSSQLTKAIEAQVLTAVNQYVYQNGQIKAVLADPTQSTPGTNVNVTAPAAS